MSHRGVTLKEAGKLIGGDKPLSKRTVSAMIARGDLEAYGAYGGRRVTMRSILAYQDGERGQWQNESSQKSASDVPLEAATLPRRRTGRGRDISPDKPEANMSEGASIPGRLPKRGVIRS